MEAVEFIEYPQIERGNQSDAPIQTPESFYAVTVWLTDAEHKLLQRLRAMTGQDDNTAIRTCLRVLMAKIESGDIRLI
jgi:hypothetical protein